MTTVGLANGSRLAAAFIAVALLAGCGGLLPEPPKRQLYRTTPAFAFAAGLPHVRAQLLVAVPTAPAALDSRRIALSRSTVSLDYFADAEWADRAPFLIQTALVEAFEKSAALAGVAPEGLGLRADFVLETALRNFEAVYDSPDGAPRVVVRLDPKLVRLPELRIIAQGSVTREARAAANSVADIVHAFDVALGEAAQQVVIWAVTNPALSERGRAR